MSAAGTADDVRRAVGAVTDPEIRRPLAELDMVRDVRVDGSTAHVAIALTIVGCPAAARIERDVRDAAASVPGVTTVELTVGVMTPAERAALTERLRGGRTRVMPFGPDSLTRVIAVTSGKGGVGKSTLTANLAVALAERSLAVGLIDADVHGFSIPALLGLVEPDGLPPQPTRIDDLMLPPVAYGVKTISIGMFLPRDQPASAVAWRGPMLHRTVQQFLTDVFFGDLDILLLDMPPGTGDVAISVGQLLPHADVLVVTTPQTAASDVAVRSGLVAGQTGQRVIGVVENMAAAVRPSPPRCRRMPPRFPFSARCHSVSRCAAAATRACRSSSATRRMPRRKPSRTSRTRWRAPPAVSRVARCRSARADRGCLRWLPRRTARPPRE